MTRQIFAIKWPKKKEISCFLLVIAYFNARFVQFLIILSHLEAPLWALAPWLGNTALCKQKCSRIPKKKYKTVLFYPSSK